MQLAALQRWHWMAIALFAGTIVGFARDSADSQLYGLNVQGYGMLLTDQQQFENGLVQDYNGLRLFSDPVVYPHWTTERGGQKKLVYIVSGRYWDGREQIKDGKSVAEWLPRCIITRTPYRPRIGIAEGGPTVQEYPSVVEFLDAMHRVYKVNYQYAWWALHPVLTWVVGCLIVIGGVWPTLVNLLAFGRLTRPPEVKPVSLWNVRAPKSPEIRGPSFAPESSGDDEGFTATTVPAAESSDAPPAPAMAGGPLELTPEGPRQDREYGADEDDYYPTERHAHGAKPPR